MSDTSDSSFENNKETAIGGDLMVGDFWAGEFVTVGLIINVYLLW